MGFPRKLLWLSLLAVAVAGLKHYCGGPQTKFEDMTGKVVLITGGNAGIGLETVRGLAMMGATVHIACRNAQRCSEAVEKIYAAVPAAKAEQRVHSWALELASLESVRAFADKFRAAVPRLHVLINNAGVMGTPYEPTAEGFEMQIGVNHLGHYLLTRLLLPPLLAAAPSRIVHVSSRAHRFGAIDLTSFRWDKAREHTYSLFGAYGQSKLANILFSNALHTRLAGTGVTSTVSHPGVIITGLASHLIKGYEFLLDIAYPFTWILCKSEWQGAQTSLFQAVSRDMEGVSGVYLSDNAVAAPWILQANNVTLANELWSYSAQLVGLPETDQL